MAAAYPVMVRQGSGHIVNTASLAGLVSAMGLVPYTASKYGVVGPSNALRVEGAHYGVKVSVVCPGFIRTPIYESVELMKVDREKMMRTAPRGMPTGKCARCCAAWSGTRPSSPWRPRRRCSGPYGGFSPALVRALFAWGLSRPMRAMKSG